MGATALLGGLGEGGVPAVQAACCGALGKVFQAAAKAASTSITDTSSSSSSSSASAAATLASLEALVGGSGLVGLVARVAAHHAPEVQAPAMTTLKHVAKACPKASRQHLALALPPLLAAVKEVSHVRVKVAAERCLVKGRIHL